MSGNATGKKRKDFLASYARIKDPGSAGTIRPVNDGEISLITTAAAEDRTMEAAASYPYGFRHTVILNSDGGDCTLDSCVNAAGGAGDVVLDDEGDWVLLEIGVSAADTKAWRIIASDGCTVPS